VLAASILAVGLSVYLVLVGADRIIAVLGRNGLNVLKRIMGLMVMVIAVEFCVAGLRPILVDILREGLAG
jgi:multiple antibiotic resistance protein